MQGFGVSLSMDRDVRRRADQFYLIGDWRSLQGE
jgi:hypothetical protein